jgi:hypothetical protein
MERPNDLSAQDAAALALNLPLAERPAFARRISGRSAPLPRARNPKKASADSAEKNAGARGKGGFVLKRARRIVRQVRTFRTFPGLARTGGCSAGDAPPRRGSSAYGRSAPNSPQRLQPHRTLTALVKAPTAIRKTPKARRRQAADRSAPTAAAAPGKISTQSASVQANRPAANSCPVVILQFLR